MTVTIADAKDHSRVLHDDDDLLFQRLIDADASLGVGRYVAEWSV